MVLKKTLFMTKLNQTRTIHIYVPDSYTYTNKRYPVLYMFDGHNLFFDQEATYGKSWNLMQHIQEENRELIVVGQECSHEGNNRLDEYGPYPFADAYFGTFEGKGDLTMDFFVHELKPYMDTNFPTISDREHTWIGGSSCGGLMAYYALCAYNSIYSKALVISPYVQVVEDYLYWQTEHTDFHYDTSVYISWGAMEYGKHHFFQETKICTNLVNQLIQKGVYAQMNVKLDGEHTERSWEEEVPTFLSFLFQ